jgi:hypothetical protein
LVRTAAGLALDLDDPGTWAEGIARAAAEADRGLMPVVVHFEDGPAVGQTRDYPYLSIALPRLAWMGDRGEVQAVYDRACDNRS